MNYDTNFKSVKDQVSPEEWQARVELAACYRLVDQYGMTDLIYNHITARIPGTEHLLINLYGLLYKEITASSLVKIDVEGEIIAKPDTDYGINKSGYVIHGAIHKARPDVKCVLHTHTRAGIAVSAMNCGLLPLSQTSIRFHNHIGYHDFEGPAVDLDERERIVKDLGEHNALVMRNHGLLTCGPSVPEAFNLMYQLEQSCRSQVDAMAARTELNVPGENVLAHTAHLYQPGHAAALRRAGMAGDAPPARRRAEELGLSAVLALSGTGCLVDEAAAFEYSRPPTIDEACALLAADDGARVIAGGQTLVPLMAMRLARPTRLIDIARIPGLSYVRDEGGRNRDRRDDQTACDRERSGGPRQAAAARQGHALRRPYRDAGARHGRRLARQRRPGGRDRAGRGDARRDARLARGRREPSHHGVGLLPRPDGDRAAADRVPRRGAFSGVAGDARSARASTRSTRGRAISPLFPRRRRSRSMATAAAPALLSARRRDRCAAAVR